MERQNLAMGFGSDFLAQRHAENTHPVRVCQSSVAGAAGSSTRLKHGGSEPHKEAEALKERDRRARKGLR